MGAEYPAIAQDAAKQSAGFSNFLERLLKTEVDGRHELARQTMLKLATPPAIRTLEEYDFALPPARRRRRSANSVRWRS